MAAVMHCVCELVGVACCCDAYSVEARQLMLCLCAMCRAERAQRLGRNGSDPPASPPRADPSPPNAKGGPFRREDGEIVGESPSTSKRHAETGRQRAGR